MGFNKNWIFSHKLASLVHIVSVYLLLFFSFISRYIFSRLQRCGGFFDNNKTILHEKTATDSEIIDNSDRKEKKSGLHLKFKFPSFEEFSIALKEKISSFMFKSELVPCESISKVIVRFGERQNGKRTEAEELSDEFQFCCEGINDHFLCDEDFGDIIIYGENEKKTNLESVELYSKFLSETDFNGNLEDENDGNSENINLGLENDANKLESLWEHQELIDQLRMELRGVRATVLPTILEESESPKIKENPWEIEEKVEYEDSRDELHKSYQGYTQMMRKFDILNYQTTYAMGFLDLSDPFRSKPQQKNSAPTLRTLVSESRWSFKRKNNNRDPVKKMVKEVHGDLEVVYVGQMCLSWEFLHWQYDRALELWNTDPSGIHRYDEVAGEFQQFRALVEKFVEDEPYQGPRVQSYVKSRCVLRNLLQVPLIREDNLKGKKKSMKRDGDNEHGVTSEMLVEIVEESIQILWRFIRSDKDCYNSIAMSSNKKLPELHNNQDLKLLLEVRKNLQKKEKKLFDILRGENCILRKFQQNKENDWDEVLKFFGQVDMKLVSRVISMSKIRRDQLIWCRNKLSRIKFVNRKIIVEPGFLLFPYN